MFGGRPKLKELSWQGPVFRIACLETKEKVCRKEKPGKEDDIFVRMDEGLQTGKLWRVKLPAHPVKTGQTRQGHPADRQVPRKSRR
jgi:hypothetical protein